MAIGSALTAVGSLAGAAMSVAQQSQTNAMNRAMVHQQNQWNLDQWQRENAYNHPVNQVQRLRAAGINPGILYGSGGVTNTSAPSPTMQASKDVAPQIAGLDLGNPLQDAVTMAQIRNIDADTRGKELQNEYQDYMNEVERQLSKIPLGSVSVIDDNGNESVEVVYGNARVRMARSEMRMLGLSEHGLQYQLADLFYDLFVKVGDNSFTDLSTFSPEDTPNYDSSRLALRGDNKVRYLSGQLAEVAEKAAQAEKAGREAYGKWLEQHKNDPVVKFALTLQGFFQTLGVSIPSVSVNNGSKGKAVNWFFGK